MSFNPFKLYFQYSHFSNHSPCGPCYSQPHQQQSVQLPLPTLPPPKPPHRILGMRGSDIDKYSRVIFPIMFTCFHMIYWTIYLSISGEIPEDLVYLEQFLRNSFLNLPSYVSADNYDGSDFLHRQISWTNICIISRRKLFYGMSERRDFSQFSGRERLTTNPGRIKERRGTLNRQQRGLIV